MRCKTVAFDYPFKFSLISCQSVPQEPARERIVAGVSVGHGLWMRGCNTLIGPRDGSEAGGCGTLWRGGGIKKVPNGKDHLAPFLGGVELLLSEEQFHDLASGLGYAGAGAEDGGGACLVEEVVVLCGDNATHDYHDVLAAQFLEFLDYLRNQSLVTGGK